MCKYQSFYKYQLANAANVSLKTLNRWLKNDTEEIQKLGFKDGDKLLNPAIVKFICEKYVIDLE